MDVTLRTRGLYLEYLTLAWNVIGSVLILRAAYQASSIALAGFGLDSVLEIGASLVVVWQLRGGGKDRERRALRLIGVAFLGLALYVLVQSLRALLHQTTAATSPFGMIIAYLL